VQVTQNVAQFSTFAELSTAHTSRSAESNRATSRRTRRR
jgi:hypothetical protein